jgi:hypothetical protein
MQTLGRVAIIGGGVLVSAVNVAIFAGAETLPQAAKVAVYGRVYTYALLIPVISVLGVADPEVPGEHLASVQSLTRWYNQCLEKMIRSFPEQYWWVHRRWRGEPPQKRSSRAA